MATWEQSLEEARRRRELGFCNDANRLFDEALSTQPDDIPLVLEAAGAKLSQGLVGDCRTMVAALDARVDRANLDPVHLAMLDVFSAIATATATVKFREPLRRASEAYARCGHDKPVEAFDKSMVAIAAAYHNLLALTQNMSYQHDVPLPSFSAEFQSSLARHLLAEKRYGDAIKIAGLSSFAQQSYDNTPILQALLADEGVSKLQRAEVLWEYGDKTRLTGGGDGWREHLASAAELYGAEGHATGALDVRVDLMRRHGSEGTLAQDTAELWRIKDVFEAVGNWASINRALVAIIEINTRGASVPPESLQAQVEEEWLRATDRCCNNLGGVSSSIVKILEWQSTKSRSAMGLEYLEHYYDKIKDCDAHVMIAVAVMTLYDVYKKIGETDRARECISRRPAVLPRWFVVLHGIDAFESAMDAAVEAADTDVELHSLREELLKVRGIIRRTPDLLERAAEVERLSNMCNKYLMQHQFRGYHQLKQLVDCIIPVIDDECSTLDDKQAVVWRGQALQCRGLLAHIKTGSSTTIEELQGGIEESTAYYQQVVDLYEASRPIAHAHVGGAKVKLANNRRLLWQLKGKPCESDDFEAAAALYADEVGNGELGGRQRTCMSLLRHWFEGFQAKVRVHGASAYDMAVKWADEADRLAGIQRNDLSALPRERAVLAKQLLSRRDPAQDFHLVAIRLHDMADDDLGTWKWLQRSKARSISDMLALGINIPRALSSRIASDGELVDMCEAEERLLRERSTAPADRLFLVQRRLDAHRDEMRKRPALKQVLDYREGQPTSLEKLQNISARSSSAPNRTIFYVDWLVFEGHCIAIVASSAGISSYNAGASAAEMDEWKSRHLGDGAAASHPLLDSPDALRQLSKLVQPLLERTAPGDILVFCPSGVLHGIPLHAATLGDGSGEMLLERNPVVYTASMTTFEQCVSKELDRERSDRHMSRSYVAVFEETEGGPLNDGQRGLRDEIYATVRKVAARRQPSSTVLGRHVKTERLVAAFEADYAYFFGHCESSAANMLLQGLVICGDARDETAPVDERLRGLQLGGPANDQQARAVSRKFTASDMFGIDIKTSCLTLLACASATEGHGQGEEPLGIISAVLCAGATSVIGTMWKVQADTAGIFTSALDVQLGAGEKSSDDVVDLAVAVQKTVLRLKARGEGNTNLPRHWAAFVLHGSWFMSRRRLASDS